MAIWVVRGGSSYGDAEADFLRDGSVGIYFFVDHDLTGMSVEALDLAIHRDYRVELAQRGRPTTGPHVQGRVTWMRNQTIYFRDHIREGDTIVMPRKASGGYRIAHGRVTSGYQYWGEPYPHRRLVDWMAENVSRDEIGYPWSISDQRTVFRVDG